MKKLTDISEWQWLRSHAEAISNYQMRDLFAQDHGRFDRYSLSVGNLFLDYSKNRITDETLFQLCKLADACQLSEKITAMFTGETINSTEQRAVLHTALRQRDTTPVLVNGKNVIPLIHAELDRMATFCEAVRSGTWRGYSNKPITDIVNIGMGGSYLGPLLTTHAMTARAQKNLRCHFMADIDSSHVQEILQALNPETTLFLISSKSFTTLETLTNAKTAWNWLKTKTSNTENLQKHFVAITAQTEKALQFGIAAEQIFELWDWVGGRYSVWSAIGLPLAIMIGMDNFRLFLAGAEALDQHFRSAPFGANMPVILALLGIWYGNFFHAAAHAIIPYDYHLTYLRDYIQQMDMESNGKTITHGGVAANYSTGPIVWGELGSHGQHAFHQLLHQGSQFVPVDFILTMQPQPELSHYQDILLASCFSQSQALLQGKTYQEASAELLVKGYSEAEIKRLAPHQVIPGNRPSNTLLLDELTPYNLGMLLALYEHKVFVQSVIWDINSFDQWGIELGKQLITKIMPDLATEQNNNQHDVSTLGLMAHYKKFKTARKKIKHR